MLEICSMHAVKVFIPNFTYCVRQCQRLSRAVDASYEVAVVDELEKDQASEENHMKGSATKSEQAHLKQ